MCRLLPSHSFPVDRIPAPITGRYYQICVNPVPIEQDADIVLFLYRDAYYNRDSDEHNIAECMVAKNRHGETDSVKLTWDGRFTRFGNPEFYRDEP